MSAHRNDHIGERVRFYRTTRGLSLEKLSGYLEKPITPQQFARYETGQSRWPADLICEIARLLTVDVRLLLGLEDGKHEAKEDHEWMAERYKVIMLQMPPKARSVTYQLIDGIAAMGA